MSKDRAPKEILKDERLKQRELSRLNSEEPDLRNELSSTLETFDIF